MDQNTTTHFGFQQVKAGEKAGRVADVFHSVAAKYDVMNDVMSFGIHRLWKRFTLEAAGARQGQCILDIAGGTGDLAAQFARQVGPQGLVVLADINNSMLSVGRNKLLNNGLSHNLRFAQADAQYLPFPDNCFDCITIAFGLRNVTDKDLALRSMHRVLKPGGKLLVLEFSKPQSPVVEKLYDQYSFHILPRMGQLIANDSASYQYLAESIRMHPDQNTLKNMVLNAGFNHCDIYNLTGGIVALHKATKA